MRRVAFLAVSAIAISLVSLPKNASAQSMAGRQIRLVVPFPAGGPTDIVARPFAQMLGERSRQSSSIDNRGGAGGSIGAERGQVRARRQHAAHGDRRHACDQCVTI